MDVVQQHSPLSMGWCVNCHRETEVQFDNPCYEHYEQIHEELASGERKGNRKRYWWNRMSKMSLLK